MWRARYYSNEKIEFIFVMSDGRTYRVEHYEGKKQSWVRNV